MCRRSTTTTRRFASRPSKGAPTAKTFNQLPGGWLLPLDGFGPSLFPFYINQDAKAPDVYIPYFVQAGLGLPDRDYYLKADDAKMAATKAKYEQHVATILQLAGDKDAQEKADPFVLLKEILGNLKTASGNATPSQPSIVPKNG